MWFRMLSHRLSSPLFYTTPFLMFHIFTIILWSRVWSLNILHQVISESPVLCRNINVPFLSFNLPMHSGVKMPGHVVSTIFVVFIVSFAHGASYTRASTKVVSTKYGVIRGLLTQFSSELRPHLQPVESYLGIPYAAAPTGNLRFMPPTTPAHFESGVRNATQFGPVCPQSPPNVTALAEERNTPRSRLDYLRRLDVYLRNQSEDCLYLNIYVPSTSRGKKALLSLIQRFAEKNGGREKMWRNWRETVCNM